MKNKLLFLSIVLCSLGLSAQVQIDKDLQLNGTSGNRDISGAQTIDVSVGYLFGNSPGTSGQVLRSNGTTGFVAASIVASDLPDLSGSYIKNQTTQQTGANFNVAGTGVIGTTLRLDDANANNGTTTNALIFGAAGSGEGIGSKRTATGNQFGLDFYTNGQNRMAITNGGNVGIGTTTIPTESRLVLGALGGDEGGQLQLNAPGGAYTNAFFLDNYQNLFRVLGGTNSGSSTNLMTIRGSDGAIFGKFRQVLYQNFNNPAFRNTNGVVWFPVGFESDDRDIVSTTAGPNHDPKVEFVAPYSGRIIQVRFQVDGTSSGSQEARGRIVSSINGTIYYYTAAGTMMDLNESQGATIGFPAGTTGFSFSQGDRVALGFIYGEANNAGCPSSDCYLEDNDYGVITIIEYNVQY